MNLTLKQYIEGVENKTFSPKEIIKTYTDQAKEKNKELNAFIRFHDEYIDANIENFSNKLLKGAPIGIKDLILTKGYVTSGGAKILEKYNPPYSATCFKKLEESGGLMIGKTNCDQFGMGSSTENSYFGITKNPYGENRIPGGSSGGSAVAVAADMCLGALGTDTGGSSRQPAAMCNTVGLKPTYGRISRYGVMAYGSSFDQVGIFSKTVEDAKILLESIAGSDPQDSTTNKKADDKNRGHIFQNTSIKGLKVALPKEFLGEGLDPQTKGKLMETVEKLKKGGAEVHEINMPILKSVLSIYYTLVPAEVSTNLSRLDGIRYGLQEHTIDYENIGAYYNKIRSEGFLDETKRRILVGTFVLSSANYEGYYLRAQKARIKLQQEFKNLFETYDLVLSPTSPEPARKIGEMTNDPVKMYLADIYTVTANLAQIPAISLPAGFVDHQGESLPVGMQFMANKWREDLLFQVGHGLENMN